MLWPHHPLESSVYCLGRQCENMFIAVILATEGGRRGRGGRGGGSHTLLPAVSFSLEALADLITGTVSPGTAGGLEGSCGRGGHLLSLSCCREWWSFEISPVCLRSKIYSAGGYSLSVAISKILFLKLLL